MCGILVIYLWYFCYGVIQSKKSFLQEAQEKSRSVHATLCNDDSERAQPTENLPATPGGTKPEVATESY